MKSASDDGTEHSEQGFVDKQDNSDEEEIVADEEEIVDKEHLDDEEEIVDDEEHEEESVEQQGKEPENVRAVAEIDPTKLKPLTHQDIAKQLVQEMRRRAESVQKRMSFALPNMAKYQ